MDRDAFWPAAFLDLRLSSSSLLHDGMPSGVAVPSCKCCHMFILGQLQHCSALTFSRARAHTALGGD